jgi:hypothetical protein
MRGQERLVLLGAEPLACPVELAVAHVDDVRCASVLAAQDAQHLRHHGRKLAVRDQHRYLAVLQLPGQQRCVETDVERMQYRIECRHGVVGLHHLRHVGQHDADCGAALHA